MFYSTQKRSWSAWFNRSPRRQPRSIRLTLEVLEDRTVLSTLFAPEAPFGQGLTTRDISGFAVTNNLIVVNPNGFASPLDSAANAPYTPAQIRQAYGFTQIAFNNGTVPGDGSGQTIAIVDAYDDPNIANDLHQFDLKFSLPDPSLTVVKQTSTPVDSSGGWEMEESLDVEWAHAMAPRASILLVEANSTSGSALFQAVQWAASQPGVSVVSMSFGLSYHGESSNDSYFTTPQGHAGVTFVAAAGDQGGFIYPASSPNVLAVGGTTLTVYSSGNYDGETVWNEGNGWSSGGGPDPNYPAKRGPDVTYNAGAAVWVYDSFDNSQNPWIAVGGTSAGAPQWAALIAIADQGRALEGQGSLNGASQTLPMIHNMPNSAFHTNIPGSNQNGVSGAGVIGMGSPYADRVVAGLTGQLIASGNSLTAVSGQAFTGTVASFAVYSTSTATYSAVINWGNGTISTGQVVNEGNGQYAVAGTNTYANAGSYTISVRVQGSDGTSATIESNVIVRDIHTDVTSPVVGGTNTGGGSNGGTNGGNPTPQSPPSPMQLLLDGVILAMYLSGPGGPSAALADAALMHDIYTAPGGLYNPYLDAGYFYALSVLEGSHNS